MFPLIGTVRRSQWIWMRQLTARIAVVKSDSEIATRADKSTQGTAWGSQYARSAMKRNGERKGASKWA